jgi:hypothetical protein
MYADGSDDRGVMTRVDDDLMRATADLFLMVAETVGQRLVSVPLPPTVQITGSVVEARDVGH